MLQRDRLFSVVASPHGDLPYPTAIGIITEPEEPSPGMLDVHKISTIAELICLDYGLHLFFKPVLDLLLQGFRSRGVSEFKLVFDLF